jgi:hypothetical protein
VSNFVGITDIVRTLKNASSLVNFKSVLSSTFTMAI